jgi:predicted kinase
MARLVLLCGLPGSGKTTVARRLAAELDAIRLCPDEWMVTLGVDLFDQPFRARLEALQWELAQELLQLGQSVVIEWGVWARSERDAVRRRARELGVPVELHYLDEPLAVLWERVRHRNEHGPPGTAIITYENLVDWSEHLFEAPTPEELALFDPPTRTTAD